MSATLIVVGVALEILIAITFWRLTRQMSKLERSMDNLRLRSRTRIRSVGIFDKTDEEAQLRRLGRSSRNKRMVVGGEVDSQLRQDLERTVTEDGGDTDGYRLPPDGVRTPAAQRRSARYVGGD